MHTFGEWSKNIFEIIMYETEGTTGGDRYTVCDTDQETRLEMERQEVWDTAEEQQLRQGPICPLHHRQLQRHRFRKNAFLIKRGTNLIVPGMKDTSEGKGKPFSSSLNIYPEAYYSKGWGRVE